MAAAFFYIPTGLESCAYPGRVLQLGVALHRFLRGDHGENVAAVDVSHSLGNDGVTNLSNQNLSKGEHKITVTVPPPSSLATWVNLF